MEKGAVNVAASAAGGRRRRMLAETGGVSPAANALQMADVEALKNDPSAEGRAQLARKFGESFDTLATSRTRDLAQAILGLLVADIEKEVRKTLAETVGGSHKLPVPIAKALANDDIEVAGPILRDSPVLTDAELSEIVRTNAMQYALAVAGRERISEQLSETLVETGDQRVVVRLVGNVGAKLSSRTLRRVMDDYREDEQIQHRLVRRPELPYEMVEEMVGIITSKLEWELIENRCMSADQAKLIMKGVRERASIGLTAKDHGDRTLTKNLRDRHQSGELAHEDVLGFLRDGDISSFETALTLMAGLDAVVVRRLAYDTDRRRLAALCARASFPCPHYITLRMALEMAEATVSPDAKSTTYGSDTMLYLQKQYDRLRQNEQRISEIIEEVS